MEGGVFGDLSARQPKPTHASAQGLIPVGGSGRSQIFGPDGAALTAAANTAAAGGNAASGDAGVTDGEPGAYRLNFENAEIKDVVHAVLGEALKLNYTISPDVGGTVTVASSQPVGRDALLSTLDAILAAQGFSMTKSGSVYKIGPLAPGAGNVDRGGQAQPGYGISVVPLHYVSVKTMVKLLGGFVADAEGLRIDSTQNALVISGPSSKRDDVMRTAASFDQDWMSGQTAGIFQLNQSEPDAVVKELDRVFDSSGGAGTGLIQFQPIQRLKSILVLSKNPTLIQRAGTWIRRLDGQAASVQQNIFVYRPQYRDASELAKVLASLFGAGGDTGKPAFSANQGITSQDKVTSTGGPAQSQGADNGSEPPIDNVTGAGEATDGSGTGGDGTDPNAGDASGGAPGVIDLTQGGGDAKGPSIRVSADLANNTVVTYTDAETYKQVLAALQRLDAQPYQVAIQATIAEVTLNDELAYGVQYYLKNTNLGIGQAGSVGFPGSGAAISAVKDSFNFILGSNSNPGLIVSALNKVTEVEILSSPSLVVMENQTAKLQVGDDVPVEIGTTSTIGGTTTQTQMEYRSTGIILKVTPRIGENGSVTMKVDQEISAVSSTSSKSTNPTFSTRKVSSQISVVSGQTVVLAGLISTQKSVDRSGLPLFSRIPGIRDLAGNNDKGGKRTELVVLIKPMVIHSSDDAQTVAEELKSRLWAIGSRENKAP
ncbi:type II secretion system secretin GspD [Oryzibacter oryziterrae]|uniref:type II secretion system secretin GspD n=1 Tax=Oryzibacter oryziterrae TaxID=2766474 RepID=UPI001F011BBE|nr:type II secretion system secretin GspD [Oryzibacter oryziterrae]